MKSLSVSPVKKAASLILSRSSSQLNSFYDYQILMLERKVLISIDVGIDEIIWINVRFPWGKI